MTIAQDFALAATKLITRNAALSREDAIIAGQVVGFLTTQFPAPDTRFSDHELNAMIHQGVDRFAHDPAKFELIRSTLSEAYDIACDPHRFGRLMEPHRSVG